VNKVLYGGMHFEWATNSHPICIFSPSSYMIVSSARGKNFGSSICDLFSGIHQGLNRPRLGHVTLDLTNLLNSLLIFFL
jgi:hypothetical protein